MLKNQALRLAVRLGVVAEIVLCGAFMLFGGFGPCGPSNDFTGFALMFHLPGILVAQQFGSASDILFIPFALLSGSSSFTLLFWIIILLWKKFRSKGKAT